MWRGTEGDRGRRRAAPVEWAGKVVQAAAGVAARTAAWSSMAVMLLLVTAAPVSAQEPTSRDRLAAREHFEAGVRFAEERDWPAALNHFSVSYRLLPRPNTLLNLAGAQAQTGHLVAALASYRRYLRDAHPDSPARDAAAGMMQTLGERIAHLTIRLRGLTARDAVSLDGNPLSTDAMQASLPMDPGEHAIEVMDGDEALLERSVVLHDAERLTVELDLTAVGRRDSPSPPGPGDVGEQGGLLASPWFWIGVGVVAAAAAVGAVATLGDGATPAYTGNLTPGHTTVR